MWDSMWNNIWCIWNTMADINNTIRVCGTPKGVSEISSSRKSQYKYPSQENTVVVEKDEGNNNLVLYIGSTGPNVLGKELNKFQTRDLLNIYHKCLNNKLLNILDNMATTSIFHNTMHGRE